MSAAKNLIFADACAPYKEAKFVIFGAPYDGTSCFRTGSRWAPNAMREASYNFETFIAAYGIELTSETNIWVPSTLTHAFPEEL